MGGRHLCFTMVYTYSDNSGCMQTRWNKGALWITMKGTGIDTGKSSSTVAGSLFGGKTCSQLGYTKQSDMFKDLPGVIKAAYAGVSTWSKATTKTTTTTKAT